MNPPFGTKVEGIDMVFVQKAMQNCEGNIYSMHKTSTRDVKVCVYCYSFLKKPLNLKGITFKYFKLTSFLCQKGSISTIKRMSPSQMWI